MSADENIDENIDEDIDEEIEIFFNTLNAEDFKNLSSAPEIKYNFETMNEILDPLRDTENEFQNPNLKITKTVRSKVQIIIPKKELNEENSNLIKDILKFQEGYELNAEESNKTIEKVKDNFKELSDSVTQLIKLIEDIKSRYFEHAKEMMAPMIKKNEDFAKIDKNRLNQFDTKIKKLDEKIEAYDSKLTKIIKDLKEIFKRIKSNIKGYLDILNNLDKPINSMIEDIENIFNEFEEKSKNFIDIIYNSQNQREKAIKIFKEIQELNSKIIYLIDKQKKDLNNQVKTLQTEKEKCSKDFNEIKKLDKESSKKINDLLKETKDIVAEINNILTAFQLPKIYVEIKEFKGLEIDKIQEKVVEGTNNVLQANEKLDVDLSKLKKHIEETGIIMEGTVTLDLVFIMDITGSMDTYLNFAKEKILKIINKITKDSNVLVNLGFVGYRDYFDSKKYPYLIYPELTNKYDKVKEFISSAKAEGGKDCEDMGAGLQEALNYKWKGNTRFAILIADAPCHGEQYHGIKKFDSFPKGDKYKIDQLVQQFAEKNIHLMCLNITELTVKLYNNFVDYYQKGRKNKNSSSIYVGIFNDEKEDTEMLVDLIVKHAKLYYEKRHINDEN